jgi:hypothetical protein
MTVGCLLVGLKVGLKRKKREEEEEKSEKKRRSEKRTSAESTYHHHCEQDVPLHDVSKLEEQPRWQKQRRPRLFLNIVAFF